jgi:hypothetical protein
MNADDAVKKTTEFSIRLENDFFDGLEPKIISAASKGHNEIFIFDKSDCYSLDDALISKINKWCKAHSTTLNKFSFERCGYTYGRLSWGPVCSFDGML